MTRLDLILEDYYYLECLERIQAYEEDRQFCRHDLQHFLDVARIAYILLLETRQINTVSGANDVSLRKFRDVVYASGLLHDIGRWREYETGEDHAAVSSELAVEILERTGFNQTEIKEITTGISEHRRIAENMSLLGKNLYQADKLARQCGRCRAGKECYKFTEMASMNKGLFY